MLKFYSMTIQNGKLKHFNIMFDLMNTVRNDPKFSASPKFNFSDRHSDR